MNTRRICPFCGKDITGNISYDRTIPQEETVRREYSTGANWVWNYLKETKYVRRFQAFCCENCYEEYNKYEKITDKMASICIPIGIVLGITFAIYIRHFKNNMEWGIGTFFACLIYGFIGIVICSIPTMIVNLSHRKKVSYKKACECNVAG